MGRTIVLDKKCLFAVKQCRVSHKSFENRVEIIWIKRAFFGTKSVENMYFLDKSCICFNLWINRSFSEEKISRKAEHQQKSCSCSLSWYEIGTYGRLMADPEDDVEGENYWGE